jgi:hypothetical protein
VSPRYTPKSWSDEVDEAFEAEVAAEKRVLEGEARKAQAVARVRMALRDRTPYGARSEYSFFLDPAAAALDIPDPLAVERLQRHRSAAEKEKRAVTSSILGGVTPVVPLWVAEALEQAVRSTP